MKIVKINIKNYRSCVDTKFAPAKTLSVLIGPNGSGKTNVLSAIRLLQTLCVARSRRFQGQPLNGPVCELRTEFDVDGVAITHVARMNIVTNDKNLDDILACKEYWLIPGESSRRKKIAVPSSLLYEIVQEKSGIPDGDMRRGISHLFEFVGRWGVDQRAFATLERVIRFVSRITYYIASQFTNPASCPISFEVESDASRRLGISIAGHKKFLFDVYKEYREKSEKYHLFMSLVGPGGMKLIESLGFEEIKTSSSNYSVITGAKVVMRDKTNLLVVPSFEISGNTLSPSQLSEGTFKTLALVFYLVSDESSLLMIEEPEVCVHHGLLQSIVELISDYSKEKQIFVSTHSDSVLDTVEIDSVFKVSRSRESGSVVTSIRRGMKGRELAALRHYLANDGSLGEYWKHGDLEHG